MSLQLQLQPNNICCFCYSCRGLALHRTDWTIWKRMSHVLVQIYWLTVYSLTIRAVVVHLGVKLPRGFQNTYSHDFALEWVCARGGDLHLLFCFVFSWILKLQWSLCDVFKWKRKERPNPNFSFNEVWEILLSPAWSCLIITKTYTTNKSNALKSTSHNMTQV